MTFTVYEVPAGWRWRLTDDDGKPLAHCGQEQWGTPGRAVDAAIELRDRIRREAAPIEIQVRGVPDGAAPSCGEGTTGAQTTAPLSTRLCPDCADQFPRPADCPTCGGSRVVATLRVPV